VLERAHDQPVDQDRRQHGGGQAQPDAHDERRDEGAAEVFAVLANRMIRGDKGR
jgi:hypothetical protein